MRDIWLATSNEHKRKEFEHLLTPLGIRVHTPRELANVPAVEETGTTFVENALLKARALYEIVKEPVIADDSGLVVDALDGAPGIYSARYAGEAATDADNRALLLKNMENINDRRARFVAAIAFVQDARRYDIFEGTVDGLITREPLGEEGFGYDSLFFATELDKTFAQASLVEKQRVSHRARALRQLSNKLAIIDLGGNSL